MSLLDSVAQRDQGPKLLLLTFLIKTFGMIGFIGKSQILRSKRVKGEEERDTRAAPLIQEI